MRKAKRLLSREEFLRRWVWHLVGSLALLAFSLGIGIGGYMYYEKQSLLDGFLNASMLLGGMGPIAIPQTTGGKVFAGFYALYSGLVFLVAASVVLAPPIHRLVVKFRLDEDDE